MIADKDSFRELFAPVISGDPLDFPGYRDKIETVRLASREDEAVICGTARIEGMSCCLFVMEPAFMMGSMGTVSYTHLHEEKIASATARSTDVPSGLSPPTILTYTS